MIEQLYKKKIIRDFLSLFIENKWVSLICSVLEYGILKLKRNYNIASLTADEILNLIELEKKNDKKENKKEKEAEREREKDITENMEETNIENNKVTKKNISKNTSKKTTKKIVQNIQKEKSKNIEQVETTENINTENINTETNEEIQLEENIENKMSNNEFYLINPIFCPETTNENNNYKHNNTKSNKSLSKSKSKDKNIKKLTGFVKKLETYDGENYNNVIRNQVLKTSENQARRRNDKSNEKSCEIRSESKNEKRSETPVKNSK